MLEKGQVYTVRIEGYTSEGLGVCRIDGRAVFVRAAIDQELCEIRMDIVGNHTAYASIEKILEQSPHRCTALCKYAGDCGGCAFWHMDYSEELRLKKQRVLDAFSHIGGLTLQELPILGAQEQTHYRNKAQFPVSSHKGQAVCGFYRKKSHNIVEIDTCLIQADVALQVKATLLRFIKEHNIQPYNEKTHKGLLRHIYVRSGPNSKQVMLCLVINGAQLPAEQELVAVLRKSIPNLKTVLINQNKNRTNVILGDKMRVLFGDGSIEDTLCGLRFRLSARSFYQVNHEQAERLYQLAIQMAGLSKQDTVLDLYCGTGTITLCMAKHAKQAIGVEIIDEAITDAKKNARRNSISNARFFCADAAQAARQLAQEGVRPDVIVVDPPRKGLSPAVIEAMLQMEPQRIVYVSCDPATCARDVKLLLCGGYSLRKIHAVDMFPRCSHVETVVLMSRVSK